jgi:predicted  nucleic acid-binding Zn-ribbon protein
MLESPPISEPHIFKHVDSLGEYIMKTTEKDRESPKGKYIEKQEAEIKKWKDNLKELQDKITLATVDAKAKVEHSDHLQDLRKKCDDAKKKLSEIKSSENEAWEDLKGGLESIWANVSDGFQKVKAKF